MIKAMLSDIMIPKYAGRTVYFHNFNKFDSVFLFRIIHEMFKISNILPRDTGLLCFNVTFSDVNGKKFRLKFSDSIALLPFSLAYLGESFKVDVVKGEFPHNFVNADNLEYKGVLPNYKYFTQSVDMLIKYTDMAKRYNKDRM